MEPMEADQGVTPPSGTEPAPAAGAGAGQGLADTAPGVVDPDPGGAAGMVARGVVDVLGPVGQLLDKGGIAIWAIAILSVVTLAIILWKLWRYSLAGVWRRRRAETAVDRWRAYRDGEALEIATAGRAMRARLAATAMRCARAAEWTDGEAREETLRTAKALLAEVRSGLRPLELIATIAPLLGLLGTVLGMIAAFQQLQSAGSRADPSALAGGIWEALLTTAAGMAVAIPASAALTWFESVNERLRHDLEDIATRIFARPRRAAVQHAAE